MDVISLGLASSALRRSTDLDQNVIAPSAEGRFPTVDSRLDWLEGQASKIKAAGSNQLDLSQGTFTDTELSGGKIQLRAVGLIAGSPENAISPLSGSDSAVTTNDQLSSYEAWRALDGSQASSGTGIGTWKTSIPSNVWLQYEFSTPTKIVQYNLGCEAGGSNLGWMPKSWQFQAWDGSGWTVLDSRSNVSDWLASEIRAFTCSKIGMYQRYRLYITDSNSTAGVRLSFLQMLKETALTLYATSGTWESPVIDLSQGWIDTTLIEIINQESPPSTRVSLEAASSSDGVTFTGFSQLDPASPPDTRYIKIKVSMSASSSAVSNVNLDFNQLDSMNQYALDQFVTADGKLQLRTSYFNTMTEGTSINSGKLFSCPIDRSLFKKITQIEVR
ncbi:hypothetical protein GZH47_32640 (plasmid) [Paenibacillus rhizovicinus]|uniref:Discoidin domain-containing protein n=1 Tax=Paenibacillus rhizovicinus TaxID=2704463 RepID=A0A6C0PAU4_9BACL|nr:hypothetical protein [Paenibacillus rhizovicinus]QHW35648.1 hypothetical protein GZH47_32640 [Paenibacillus rhizovicinus]